MRVQLFCVAAMRGLCIGCLTILTACHGVIEPRDAVPEDVASRGTTETAPWVTDFDKPFNEYSWLTSHNAYRNDMSKLLRDGVRGFMIDIHPKRYQDDKVAICHTQDVCDSEDPLFKDVVAQIFLPYLQANPNAVITLHLESTVSRENMQAAIREMPGFARWVFDANAYRDTGEWPTLRQIINSGKRLIIFGDSSQVASVFKDADGGDLTILRDKYWQVQNQFDLGVLSDNWICLSRWSDVSMTTRKVRDTGFTQWSRLFVMNQFHAFNLWGDAHSGHRDNNLTFLERRVDQECAQTAMYRRMPNYIALDNTHTGDGLAYAAALSQGGFYFYEKNNADTSGDTVCVLPNSKDWTISLKSTGCENDEARSLKVRGVRPGTRLTVFDSPSGNRQDDYTIIDIKSDADLGGFSIPSFERNVDGVDYRQVYSRNNDLDGQISRIQIERSPPSDFSDAAVVLYEGNNATQNIVCTISLANNQRFNFGGDCDNDEARSLRVLKAKAGSSLTLYGNWNYNKDQGWAYIYFNKDILVPTVIPSFERTDYDDAGWSVFRRGSSDELDGKVSSVITWNGGESYFMLKNRVSGLCLAANDDYREAYLWTCGQYPDQQFALRGDHIQSMTEGYPYLIDSNYRIRSVRDRPADPGTFSYNFNSHVIEIRRNGSTQCAHPVEGAAAMTGLFVAGCTGDAYQQWEAVPIR